MSLDKSLRNAIVEALKQKLCSQAASNYERRIYKMCKRECSVADEFGEMYKKYAYEKVGELLAARNRREREKILLNIRGNVIGWNSIVYKDFKTRQIRDTSQLAEGIKVEKGEFPCKNRNCGSKECYYYQSQDRSGDEGFTVHVVCVKCGSRYKFN